MPAAPKNREIHFLLRLLLLAFLTGACPAFAGVHKGLGPLTGENPGTPGQLPHFVSRQEILQAIRADLARRGIRQPTSLWPEDLRIQLAVPVTSLDPGLQVKKIEYDPIRHETVFELWTSKEPRLLPFRVATSWDVEKAGLVLRPDRPCQPDGNTTIRTHASYRQGTDIAQFRLPALAKPGRPATLVMVGHNSRITTTVIPLERGKKGQWIRVRDAASHRVMVAEVVSEGMLRTSF
jgi:hypothetical protein